MKYSGQIATVLFGMIALLHGNAVSAKTITVSSSEYGDKWSFIIPGGELECVDMAVLFHTSKGTYSLNGKAISRYNGKYPEWREIAKPYPGLEQNPNAKMPPPAGMIAKGLSLCG